MPDPRYRIDDAWAVTSEDTWVSGRYWKLESDRMSCKKRCIALHSNVHLQDVRSLQGCCNTMALILQKAWTGKSQQLTNVSQQFVTYEYFEALGKVASK